MTQWLKSYIQKQRRTLLHWSSLPIYINSTPRQKEQSLFSVTQDDRVVEELRFKNTTRETVTVEAPALPTLTAHQDRRNNYSSASLKMTEWLKSYASKTTTDTVTVEAPSLPTLTVHQPTWSSMQTFGLFFTISIKASYAALRKLCWLPSGLKHSKCYSTVSLITRSHQLTDHWMKHNKPLFYALLTSFTASYLMTP